MYIIGEEEVEAVRRVIASKQLFRYRGGEGGETDKFEREWADLVGVKHALAVSNGTGALICALVGLGVGPGDEVIVPAYTFMASAAAVTAVGAVPILADVDESLTIDPADVARKLTPRTKAIMPVNMLGLPCDMDAIMAIAKKRELLVLEDACQADGGSYRGKRVGSIGQAGAFSFNYFKIITCGEGGAVTTNDLQVYQRALIHHDSGSSFREHAKQLKSPIWVGLNLRANEILSAILRVQLGRLEYILSALRREKKIIMAELAGVGSFTFGPVHDPEGDCATHVGLLFESEAAARAALSGVEEALGAFIPLDTDRHVYTNWEPILEKRAAHHPKLNAYNLAEAPVNYSKDMCANTLDVLGRTVCLATSAARSESELIDAIAMAKKALLRREVAKAG
jgi:dTDP-4-amino-4,6-dideoxygalactose transaminase